jgi:hypothetical protein
MGTLCLWAANMEDYFNWSPVRHRLNARPCGSLLGAILVVLLLGSAPQALAQQTGNATSLLLPYWNKTSITVCTSDWTPMVYCKDRDPENYSGFEIEFFKEASTVPACALASLQLSTRLQGRDNGRQGTLPTTGGTVASLQQHNLFPLEFYVPVAYRHAQLPPPPPPSP